MKNSVERNSQVSFFPEAQPESVSSELPLDGYANEEHYEAATVSIANETQQPLNGISATTEQSISPNATETLEPDPEVPGEIDVTPKRIAPPTDASVHQPTVVIENQPKHHKLSFDYRKSIILTFLLWIGEKLAYIFKNSATAELFTAFHKTTSIFKSTFLYSFFSSFANKFTSSTQHLIRRKVTDAVFLHKLSAFFSSLLRIKTRIYGLMLLSYSITSLLIHFFVSSNFDFFNHDVYAPITGIILAIVAIFLISQNGVLCSSLRDSMILSTLLYGFIGLKRPTFSDLEPHYVSASGSCIIGVLLGALTLFFPSHTILASVLTVVYIYLVIKNPEMGLISLILITPFVYSYILHYVILAITVSYALKVATGKRTPSFEFTDIFVLFFFIASLLGDIFSFGEGFGNTHTTFTILVYFLCVCMLRDTTWFDRALNSVVFITSILAAYSVFVTFLFKSLGLELVSYSPNTDFGNPEASALSLSSVLGAALLFGIFYILSYIFTVDSKTTKFGLLLIFVACVVYFIRETSVILQFSLIIALLLFMLLKTSKTIILVIIGCTVLPLLPLFYNGIYTGILTLVSDEVYRVDIWNAVIHMFKSYFFTGIGTSNEAFTTLYSSYYVGNTVNVPHAHSMILQISISLGIIGIVIFAAIVFFILQGAFSYGRNSIDKNSKNRVLSYAGMCATVAMLLCGLAENLMYNPRIMLIFWLACGLTVCARRSAKDVSPMDEILAEIDAYYYG